METTDSLRDLPPKAAAYIKQVGWTQGVEQNSAGQVCLTGALRLCTPNPGDGYLAREVFRRREHAESWNDADGRTSDQVIKYLEQAEITDAELSVVFGPQWREVVGQVRRISGATTEEVNDLAAAWAAGDAAGDAVWAARDAARDAAWDAAWAAAGDAAWAAARDAARDADQAAARDADQAAARDAAWALSTRDLIGTGNYTQDHYDTLTGPWVSVFGKLHPDDQPAQNSGKGN